MRLPAGTRILIEPDPCGSWRTFSMDLQFDNRWVRELPGDPEHDLRSREVRDALWSPVAPTPVAAPRLLAHSAEVAQAIGFASAEIASAEFAAVFAGNALLPGMQPFATRYGGHQFGHWAGQLGDGRAISLGEAIGADGRRHELQLKGAGRTPYSRHADGRAVLRSSLREFVCSEAMHALGVPTTRALSLVATGDSVVRDMFYDGHPQAEPGAIVCRVAPSFIRFGHYEILAASGETELLERLVDFTLERDFPTLEGTREARRAAWFRDVCERSAELAAHWMRIGFVHGVLNTDNMSVLGLSIDYGPYGFVEEYDPAFTPNTTDANGRRYAYGRQPAVVHWNLARFGSALLACMDETVLQDGLDHYARHYQQRARTLTAAKFGLAAITDDDLPLIADAYALLEASSIDYPLFFRTLAAQVDGADAAAVGAAFRAHAYDAARFDDALPLLHAWRARWRQRLDRDELARDARRARMDAANPLYLPRNWLCQEAIDAAAQDDLVPLQRLLAATADPYRERTGFEHQAGKRPDWARHKAGCSMLSCSS
jgi:uncharacterized protein YdiU (UPF0061 family)